MCSKEGHSLVWSGSLTKNPAVTGCIDLVRAVAHDEWQFLLETDW
jgi:hypothetical protein